MLKMLCAFGLWAAICVLSAFYLLTWLIAMGVGYLADGSTVMAEAFQRAIQRLRGERK